MNCGELSIHLNLYYLYQSLFCFFSRKLLAETRTLFTLIAAHDGVCRGFACVGTPGVDRVFVGQCWATRA